MLPTKSETGHGYGIAEREKQVEQRHHALTAEIAYHIALIQHSTDEAAKADSHFDSLNVQAFLRHFPDILEATDSALSQPGSEMPEKVSKEVETLSNVLTGLLNTIAPVRVAVDREYIENVSGSVEWAVAPFMDSLKRTFNQVRDYEPDFSMTEPTESQWKMLQALLQQELKKALLEGNIPPDAQSIADGRDLFLELKLVRVFGEWASRRSPQNRAQQILDTVRRRVSVVPFNESQQKIKNDTFAEWIQLAMEDMKPSPQTEESDFLIKQYNRVLKQTQVRRSVRKEIQDTLHIASEIRKRLEEQKIVGGKNTLLDENMLQIVGIENTELPNYEELYQRQMRLLRAINAYDREGMANSSADPLFNDKQEKIMSVLQVHMHKVITEPEARMTEEIRSVRADVTTLSAHTTQVKKAHELFLDQGNTLHLEDRRFNGLRSTFYGIQTKLMSMDSYTNGLSGYQELIKSVLREFFDKGEPTRKALISCAKLAISRYAKEKGKEEGELKWSSFSQNRVIIGYFVEEYLKVIEEFISASGRVANEPGVSNPLALSYGKEIIQKELETLDVQIPQLMNLVNSERRLAGHADEVLKAYREISDTLEKRSSSTTVSRLEVKDVNENRVATLLREIGLLDENDPKIALIEQILKGSGSTDLAEHLTIRD